MRSKRIPAEEQYRLIMECRQSGLTDHQWCVERKRKIASTCSKSSNGKSSNMSTGYQKSPLKCGD